MKKLLSIFALLTLVMSAWAADYYVAHNGKLNSNSWNPSGDKMADNGDGTYSLTYTNVSAATVQFKITVGSWSTSWKAYSNSKSNITLSESGGNIQFVLTKKAESVVITYEPSNSNKSFVQVTYAPATFSAGETITFDFTAVSGGVNYIKADGSGLDYKANGGGTRIDVTFSKDVDFTTSTTFLKTNAGSWTDVKFTDRPDNTYNIVKVASDGKSYAWTKLAPVGETKYTVTLTNATEASVEAGESGTAITAATAPAGQKFKEWVGSDGITFGNATAASTTVHATQAGTATATYEDLTMINLYFWNKDSWSDVAVYRWNGTAAADSWPGVKLTTGEYKSDNHSVYKVSFAEGEYGKIIFNNNNNGKQTGDLDNLLTHNGQCYYGKDGGWQVLPEENWLVTTSVEHGTIDANKYVGATEQTIAATAEDGYVFDRWEATGGVTIVDGTSATATITANAEGALKAIFKADASKFLVNFSAVGGSVVATVGGEAIASGAQYTIGESVDVTFSATATGSNTFYGWYDSENNKVSDENPYTVNGVSATYTIKAVYAGEYYLKHPWNGSSDWTVKKLTFDPASSLYYIYAYYGDNGFNYGNTNSVSGWNENSQTKVGNPAKHDWCYITSDASGNITVTKVTETHNLTAIGENATIGITVNGAESNTAHHMESAFFTATAADGYGFDGWYADAEFQTLLSEEASYEVKDIASDVTLYAKTSMETQYTITVANDVNTETSSLMVGASAKVLEAPSINFYEFVNWTVEGDAVIADLNAANTTITATDAATVTAHYTAKHYYIKHKNWSDDAKDWGWKEAEHFENGTYSLWWKYYNDGCNWADNAEGTNAQWISSPTLVGNPQNGDCCRFTLDPIAKSITITKIDDTPTDPLATNYYLFGSFNEWNTDQNAYRFMRENAEDNIAYVTVTLSSTDDVEFKIYKTGSCEWLYYGNEGTIDENTTFNTWWSISTDKNNCTLRPIVAGTYTFALNLSEKRIYVNFPKTSVAISGVYEYATYYGATALTVPDGVEAYYVRGISDKELIMESINVIPAETGVILYAAGGGDYEFRQTTTTEDYSAANWLKGSSEATTINNSLTHYILSATTQDNIGLYYPKGTGNNNGVGAFTNGANKAYLEVPAASPVSARAFLFRRPGVTTAIEQQTKKTMEGKYIQNGQLIIKKGTHTYNAQGQIIK